jgi:NADH-quinone oxidoreductase subunit L
MPEHELAKQAGEAIAKSVEIGWLWLIPFFPLLGAALNTAFGLRLQRAYGKRANHAIAIAAMVLSCIVCELVFWTQMLPRAPHERFLENHLWTMWQSGFLKVDFSFAIDPLSMVMTFIVTHVATLIHVYSTGYMADEKAYWRFFLWLNLFVFSMLLLVMGSNFVVMFFGWEGVGLCSYGLIGFWYEDLEKAKAAMKAFVVNRFGDFGFLIGLFILFWSLSGNWNNSKYERAPSLSAAITGVPAEQRQVSPEKTPLGPTVEFRELRNQMVDESAGVSERLKGLTLWGFPVLALICIFMFIGATGKSAQIPLYVWLPDAMAGPTPVSALIHAATMVTAGVYMVARLNFLFALSPAAMTVVACVGAATALFAASIGLFQYDIKKVLAYSTVSQLGFMFIGVGVGAYWAGIFHLMTHAFFKACLFLGSGSVILACHHEQDMRKMGGLRKYTPTTRWTYLAACVAIAGFPVASGFYSKDEILWKAWTAQSLSAPWIGHVIYIVGAIAAFGTSYYMFRSYFMTFTGEYRGHGGHEDKERVEDPHAMAAHGHALAIAGGGPATVAREASALVSPPNAAHGPAATLPSAHDAGAHDASAHGHDAHDASASAHGHDAAAHGDHGHGGVPHESPASMTVVLQILAIAAVVAGFIFGLPQAWTGHEPLLERWLSPSLPSAELVKFAEASRGTEFFFQFLGGIVIAGGGYALAWVLYADNKSPVPARLLKQFPRIWALVFEKYRVDEAYDRLVVRPVLALSAVYYWFDMNVIDALVNFMAVLGKSVAYLDYAIDKYLVDGAVNGIANLAMSSGRSMRRLQTGHIQSYLFGALGGAIVFVIIQYVIR